MSDRVVIRCPSCEQKLGIKQDLLGRQIKCPGCATVLMTRANSSDQSDSDSPPGRRQKSPGRSRAAAAKQEPTASPRQERSRRASSERAAESSPSKPRRSSASKKAKPAPVPFEDEFSEDIDDTYDDYGDPYPDDDSLDDEELGTGWLDDAEGDGWNAPSELPAPPRKKKSSSSSAGTARKKKKARQRTGTPVLGGVFLWVGAGLIAGLISVALTVAMGFTGIGFPVLLAGIVSGGLIGGTVRATAGTDDGWAPGLVAVAILFPVLVFGGLGAFYFQPSLLGIFGEGDTRTAEEIQQQIERDTSEDGMIANLIENQIDFDQQWQSENKINEDNFYADIDWEQIDEESIPYPDQYNEVVWAEGVRRWQETPEAIRKHAMESRRSELKRNEGLLTPEELATLVHAATADDAMTERVARQLQEDAEWIAESRVPESEIWDHAADHASAQDPVSRIHPVVWDAAVRKWEETDEAQKTTMRATVEAKLQETSGELEQKTFLVVAIGMTLYTLFMPFLYLGCTISAIGLAFKLGSGLASD
ncbi:MAG: hypothetical protein ABGZ35_14345 [Planctomycetaceae bacterium]